MTSEIKSYIDQIGTKSREIHQKLVIERERTASMMIEISRLKEQVQHQSEKISELQGEVNGLHKSLTEQHEQVQLIDSSESVFEIDHLVKEIDFCIQQLKIANE